MTKNVCLMAGVLLLKKTYVLSDLGNLFMRGFTGRRLLQQHY